MKKRVLALPILLAIIAACNRNDELYQPPLITATSSATPAPILVVPTPTEEPETEVIEAQVTIDNRVDIAYNHLRQLEANTQINIINKTVGEDVRTLTQDSAIALSAYFNRFSIQDQELMITSSISPVDFSNADVNIHSTRDIPPELTSLITEIFIRLGLRPYVNDISTEGAGRHSVYKNAKDYYYTEEGNIDPRTLAILVESIIKDLQELYDGYYPGIEKEHDEYVLSREFDIEKVVQDYIERAQDNTGPVVHYYLTHSDIFLGQLIGEQFILDQYTYKEIFPDDYLFALGERSLVVFLDSCPSSFLDKLEGHLENHNTKRERNNIPELQYIIRTLDDGEDENRRTPAGALINAWMLANILHEKSTLYFSHPITSQYDLTSIITGNNLLENSMDGDYDRVYNVTPLIRVENTKMVAEHPIWETFRILSTNPGEKSYDNQAISGFTHRTNIDLSEYLLDSIPLAGMNLIYE